MTQPTPPISDTWLIGHRRDGRPIYLCRGGSEPTDPPPGAPAPDPANPPAPDPAPPADPADQPLGPAGQKALAAEREARKALEKQLAELAPLKDLAAVIAGGQKPPGKSDADLVNERLATYEKDLADERQARWRAEVAQEKALSAEQAAWLSGTTREEFSAAADKLLAAFPATATTPRTPAPDPSQGARGGAGAGDLDAQIAQAQKDKDWRKVIHLQNQKLANK